MSMENARRYTADMKENSRGGESVGELSDEELEAVAGGETVDEWMEICGELATMLGTSKWHSIDE